MEKYTQILAVYKPEKKLPFLIQQEAKLYLNA